MDTTRAQRDQAEDASPTSSGRRPRDCLQPHQFCAKLAAMSVLGTLPIFIALATLQHYLVRGISLGAARGRRS